MRADQAKTIPLRTVIEYLGGRFSYASGPDDWYFSPFRPEETKASFKVNRNTNKWMDFGKSEGGSTIDLWITYQGKSRSDSSAVKEALQGLQSCWEGASTPKSQSGPTGPLYAALEPSKADKPPRYKLLKEPTAIFYDSLKDEIDRRGINFALAKKHLKQGFILDTVTNRKYNGFLLQNLKQCWEVSIPNPARGESFKTVIGEKAASFIKGSGNTKTIELFEGSWDFLTWQQMNGLTVPVHDSYILNSVTSLGFVAEQIIERKDELELVLDYFDNDTAGEEARNKLAELLIESTSLKYASRETIYSGYKDLNQWWTQELTARFNWPPKQNGQKVYNDTAWDMVMKQASSNKLSI